MAPHGVQHICLPTCAVFVPYVAYVFWPASARAVKTPGVSAQN